MSVRDPYRRAGLILAATVAAAAVVHGQGGRIGQTAERVRSAVTGDTEVAEAARSAAARLPAPLPAGDDEDGVVNFSFDQVEVATFVKLVGELTGRKFVVSEGVTGKITVVSPRVRRGEVYPLFVSILESVSCSVVQDGPITRVVPLTRRETPFAPVIRDRELLAEDGVITRVIRLAHVSAGDLANVLQSRVSGGRTGGVVAIDETNHLIVTDTSAVVRRIEMLVAEIDQPGLARVTEIVPLQFASAVEMAEQLNLAVQERAMPRERGGVAARLPRAQGAAPTLSVGPAVVAAPHANSLILVGTRVQVDELKNLVAAMDVDAPSGRGRLNAIFLKYLAADEAADSINALLEQSAGRDPKADRRIAIQASTANNALLIDASPGDFDVVRKLVDQIDRVPQQVHIRVMIAEHNVSEGFRFDLQLASLNLPEGRGHTVIQGSATFADSANSVLNTIQRGVFPTGITLGAAYGTRIDDAGNVVVGYPSLLSLDAVRQDGRFRVLSETSLEAQNNREASVSIVDDIPILKSTIEGGSGTARDVIQNIDRIEVGIKLKLTPHIIPNGEVRMELEPSIEAILDPGGASGLTPTIARRTVKTTVTVPDGQTIVIAGLTREDETDNEKRVPVLGSIPLLGRLFRQTVSLRQRSNLLVFVTPYIVPDAETAAAIREELERVTGLPVRRADE